MFHLLLPDTVPLTINPIVSPKPKEIFADRKLVFPLKMNCANEANENDMNTNVPANSAKNTRIVLFFIDNKFPTHSLTPLKKKIL